MITKIGISFAIAIAIAAIAWSSGQYYIEEAKQQAFMMKACVDAGGQWISKFQTHECIRPRERRSN